jgi:RecJ-like exonuclease
MLEQIKKFAEEFVAQNKKILVISHHDTDGICSAAIMASALQKLDKNFSVKIIKQLEKKIIENLPKNDLLMFLDLASGNLKEINKLENQIYILDHHELNKDFKLKDHIKIINPHLFNEELLSGSCLTYLFVKEIDKENKSLANLAIMGMVGDLLEKNIGKIGNNIINDSEMVIKKGLLLYPATRPLNKTLEFNSSMLIPGVTGSPSGAINLLREIGIEKKDGKFKNLIELSEDEMSKLITAILLRRNEKEIDDFIGNIYLIKFFNQLADARELSAMINACSRLDHSNIALAFCMGNKRARKKAERIYAKYKQHLIAGLNFVSNNKKIEGDDYVIINAQSNIKDTIIGTIASILSMSSIYRQGTAIVTMAHNEDKIKISARIAGRNGRNIKQVLDAVIEEIGGESGGHALAAGCLIAKEKEKEFIETLKKKLEVELVKI